MTGQNSTYEYDQRLEERFAVLEEAVRANMQSPDLALLRSAFEFAAIAHKNQLRKDGSPYVTHPLEVAIIIAEMSLDEESVVAAFLHDTIEDTGCSHDDIAARFGTAVADIVEGVTKLTRVPFSTKEELQMENLRKMLMAMARDIRVILIKIADRLHNMRTLEYQGEVKRREKSLETMEIYAPIAHRLGMQRIKGELEDLALQYLDPIGYGEIVEQLNESNRQHINFLKYVRGDISERLEENGVKASIESRIKHVYSIYRKMYDQHKAMFEMYDLYAVRVIVDTVAECYNVLGLIHDLYKPMPGRFKDYISNPKPNLYQSIHSTVIGREGLPFEVQIRTWEMHRTAEYGIAAHWRYKEGLSDTDGDALGGRLEWVRRLLEAQQDSEAEDFIRSLKVDLFEGEVFVFTPRGDVINLPKGAIPIDFAYAIHSAVGNRMTGAKVNGKIVPIDYTLNNGDIVEILSVGGHGPARDWLSLVKTGEARNKIKQWFKRERRDENITRGKNEFDYELKRAGMSYDAVDDSLELVMRKLSFNSYDEMYAAIGYGGISAQRVINRLRDELIRSNHIVSDKSVVEKIVSGLKKPKRSISGIIVESLDNCLVKFSRCCAPVPGDDIVGFVTRGYGVSIHRKDCPNVNAERRDGEESGRWVEVRWADAITDRYQTGIQITARAREGLIADIALALGSIKVPIMAINGRDLGDGYAAVSLNLELSGLKQLDIICAKLSKLAGVIEISRRNTV